MQFAKKKKKGGGCWGSVCVCIYLVLLYEIVDEVLPADFLKIKQPVYGLYSCKHTRTPPPPTHTALGKALVKSAGTTELPCTDIPFLLYIIYIFKNFLAYKGEDSP